MSLVLLMANSSQVLADFGHLEKEGIRMPVKDVVSGYDKKKAELSI